MQKKCRFLLTFTNIVCYIKYMLREQDIMFILKKVVDFDYKGKYNC
jgi:hypothetical protein